MPELATKVDLCHGHDACPARAFASFSPDVTAEGFEIAREADRLQEHGCPDHPSHDAVVAQGFPKVYVNGRRVAYAGAPVTCDSEALATGRGSVLLGEGRRLSR
ncbi:MAG: PAAR domain-containing protein [Myxococcales bacterium]|nr:PAAR domain-containing protein [Myxococcales bacterium]